MSMTAAEFIGETLEQTGFMELLNGRPQGPFTVLEI